MNRHPVDKMGDLKQQIDLLQKEYNLLRELVVNGEVGTTGSDYCAGLQQRCCRSMDYKLAEKILPSDTYKLIVSTTKQTYVSVKKKG